VQQLEQMLRDESGRLASAREELCSVTMLSNNEVMKERAESADLRRQLQSMRDELASRDEA
jgi:hypothetical protein